jgi:cell division protein FtsW (lipid II flippase)
MRKKSYFKGVFRDLGIALTGWGVAAIVASYATVHWALVVAGFAVATVGSVLVFVGYPGKEEQ